jgi:hypothetical protein
LEAALYFIRACPVHTKISWVVVATCNLLYPQIILLSTPLGDFLDAEHLLKPQENISRRLQTKLHIYAVKVK